MNLSSIKIPYTSNIPAMDNNHVVYVSPQNVQINWPNPTGGNEPQPKQHGFLASIFGK